MDPAPSASPSGSGRSIPGGDRPRILGAETEYLVLYLPDDPQDTRTPSFDLLQKILFECLLEDRRAAVSSGLKGGYFLENGGLVHLEIFLRSQADTPILEAATPECRSPRDLLLYQRAFDEALQEVSRKSRPRLRSEGFPGRIAFGKNNRDVRGTGYGFHENYLVYNEIGPAGRLVFFAGAPLVCILLIPIALFILVLLLVGILGIALGRLFIRLFPERAGRTLKALSERFRLIQPHSRAAYFVAVNIFLFLPVILYTWILRATAYRPFLQDLTPFLATRQILTGSGRLDLEGGFFEISQRAAITTSLAEIILFGKHKTVFDLKGLLYDPRMFFQPAKKLSIAVGDSNLSEVPFLIATGAAALVIEMIESGADFSDIRLRHPLRALREVSRGGPWKELRVHGAGDPAAPGLRTAMDIQREYLRRAKEHFADRPEGRAGHKEILRLWEEVLEQLSDRPSRAADRIEWISKKSLLDAAILPVCTWREFFAWSRIFSRAAPGLLRTCGSLEELLERSGPCRRARLRRRILQASRRGDLGQVPFEKARDLYSLARKIDFRFHEIGDDPGYQRQLEAQGFLRRLTADEEVLRALREPPPDTRARVRGYFIAHSQSPESIRAGWNSIEFTAPSRRILLKDPFDFKIPFEI